MEDLISSAQDYKNELFKQLSRIGKSLSSDKRLEILNLLSEGSKTVEALVGFRNECGKCFTSFTDSK